MITIILCIFDCYVGCTGLKSTAIGSFGRARRHTLVHLEHVRVHWLNRAACLVAEVKCALIGPLWRAFDAAIKAESFPVDVY